MSTLSPQETPWPVNRNKLFWRTVEYFYYRNSFCLLQQRQDLRSFHFAVRPWIWAGAEPLITRVLLTTAAPPQVPIPNKLVPQTCQNAKRQQFKWRAVLKAGAYPEFLSSHSVLSRITCGTSERLWDHNSKKGRVSECHFLNKRGCTWVPPALVGNPASTSHEGVCLHKTKPQVPAAPLQPLPVPRQPCSPCPVPPKPWQSPPAPYHPTPPIHSHPPHPTVIDNPQWSFRSLTAPLLAPHCLTHPHCPTPQTLSAPRRPHPLQALAAPSPTPAAPQPLTCSFGSPVPEGAAGPRLASRPQTLRSAAAALWQLPTARRPTTESSPERRP